MSEPTILIATWDDGLFAMTGDERKQEVEKAAVRGLAPDGRNGALAIVGGHSLRRRAPSGAWSTVATSEFELSCCMAVGDNIYVGTDDARMLWLKDGSGEFAPGELQLLQGFDRVEGRNTWFAGSAIVNGQRVGPPLGIRSVAANADGSVLFANVHVGGIPRSTDGGRTWQPTLDIHNDVHEVRGHPTDPELVAAASAVGLCLSRDAGMTWTIESDGLHAPHCAAVAFSGDDLFVSASVDPFSAEGRMYRRSIRPDGRIVAVEDGLPEWTEGKVDTSCIATKGSMVVAVDRGGNVYVSPESGRSWTRRTRGLPAPSSVLIC